MTRKPPTIEEVVSDTLANVYAQRGVTAAIMIVSYDGDEQVGTELVVDSLGNQHAIDGALREAYEERHGAGFVVDMSGGPEGEDE